MWTMQPPTINAIQQTDPKNGKVSWVNPIRTAVVRGPQGYGEWTYTFDVVNAGRLITTTHNNHTRSVE